MTSYVARKSNNNEQTIIPWMRQVLDHAFRESIPSRAKPRYLKELILLAMSVLVVSCAAIIQALMWDISSWFRLEQHYKPATNLKWHVGTCLPVNLSATRCRSPKKVSKVNYVCYLHHRGLGGVDSHWSSTIKAKIHLSVCVAYA